MGEKIKAKLGEGIYRAVILAGNWSRRIFFSRQRLGGFEKFLARLLYVTWAGPPTCLSIRPVYRK